MLYLFSEKFVWGSGSFSGTEDISELDSIIISESDSIIGLFGLKISAFRPHPEKENSIKTIKKMMNLFILYLFYNYKKP